ncbi:MAG: type II toxin-antitoxin system VapC family toxin [Tepidiformaceae bacterium]
MALCFDSNIVIDALNGRPEAAVEISGATVRVISIVTWIEVVAGAPTAQAEQLARELLTRFRVVNVTPAIAEVAVAIRRRTRLKLPDSLILATAQVSGCQLSTRNTKDFLESDPTIRVPYRL